MGRPLKTTALPIRQILLLAVKHLSILPGDGGIDETKDRHEFHGAVSGILVSTFSNFSLIRAIALVHGCVLFYVNLVFVLLNEVVGRESMNLCIFSSSECVGRHHEKANLSSGSILGCFIPFNT